MSGEKTFKHRPVLIIGQDTRFREELYNFLLSAGYRQVEEIDRFDAALDQLTRGSYGAIMADAGLPLAIVLPFAIDLTRLSPNTKIVLMIEPGDQPAWDQVDTLPPGIDVLIKTNFARDLLYLLQADSLHSSTESDETPGDD